MYLSKDNNELCLCAIQRRKVKLERKDRATDIRNLGMPAAIKRDAEVIAEAIAAQSGTPVVPTDAMLVSDDGEIIWYFAIPIPANLEASQAYAVARLYVLLQRPQTPDTVDEIAECAALTNEKAMTVLQERVVSKLPKKSGSLVAVPIVIMCGETEVATHDGELREKPANNDTNPVPFSDQGRIFSIDRIKRTFSIEKDVVGDESGSSKRQKRNVGTYTYDPETIGDEVAEHLIKLENHVCVHGEARQSTGGEVRDAVAVQGLPVESDAAKKSRSSAVRKRSKR